MPVSEDLMYVCVHLLASVMSNSSRPHGLQPTRLLCPWDSPGKNTGVRCHALLQGIFQLRVQPASPALQADSLPPSHWGGPRTIRNDA